MSLQKQWSDFHLCDVCLRQFDSQTHIPYTLVCGHTYCKKCLLKLKTRQCLHDKNVSIPDLAAMLPNFAILNLLSPIDLELPRVVTQSLNGSVDTLKKVLDFITQLAVFLKPLLEHGAQAIGTQCNTIAFLTRAMLKKLVVLVNSEVLDTEGRGRVMRAARSLAERSVTELLVIHQGQQQISHLLWTAIRNRGCQFLGPVMQEETLKLIVKVLEGGESLSRKNIVRYVVEQLEKQFPQASRTSVGHVVQLLYRSSCFNVDKRDGDSSLMQLKEDYRNHDALRKEHDTQIVRISMEAGLRITPEQLSSLLYGDQKHKSHMQSIIDKLIAMGCASPGVDELTIALERTQDPYSLSEIIQPLEQLLNNKIEPTNGDKESKESAFSLDACLTSLEALLSVVSQFVNFMKRSNGISGGGPTTPQIFSGKYKTGLCRDLERPGGCPRGSNCTYAHSHEERDRYRATNQRKGKFEGGNTKPKTGPISNYNKSPMPMVGNMTTSLPVNPGYPHQYMYDNQPGSGNPSPPSTGTYPLVQPQIVQPKPTANQEAFSRSYEMCKDGSLLQGEHSNEQQLMFMQSQLQRPPPHSAGAGSGQMSVSALRSRREYIKRMMENGDQDEFPLGASTTGPSSLPDHSMMMQREDRKSGPIITSSDEEDSIGSSYLNKTHSFPDLTSADVQKQQQLAFREARLKQQEEALQQRQLQQREVEMEWQRRQTHGAGGRYQQQRYSGEQQPPYQPYYAGSWSSTSPRNTGYIYGNPSTQEQRWSGPRDPPLVQEMSRMGLQDAALRLLPGHSYDVTHDDPAIAHYIANQEQRKLHNTGSYGYSPSPYYPSVTSYNTPGYPVGVATKFH